MFSLLQEPRQMHSARMAIFNLLSWFSFLILLILHTHHPSLCSALSNENRTMTVAVAPSPPRTTPLNPEMAAIIASLAAFFSITLLLLLYAKHCNRSTLYSNTSFPQSRRNSGVNRGVIQSLPLFRFSAQKYGGGGGLECPVCLTQFQADELLRLLPKCKHAFHVECVDTWLDCHSTCPLCRYRVDAEDILLLLDMRPRISGKRDSSSSSLEIIIENPGRFSLDGWNFRRKTGKPRKDGQLPVTEEQRLRLLEEGRRRWSDAEAELAYLRRDRIPGCSGVGVISGKSVSEFEFPNRCNNNGGAMVRISGQSPAVTPANSSSSSAIAG